MLLSSVSLYLYMYTDIVVHAPSYLSLVTLPQDLSDLCGCLLGSSVTAKHPCPVYSTNDLCCRCSISSVNYNRYAYFILICTKDNLSIMKRIYQ